jgi:hypothetical protein
MTLIRNPYRHNAFDAFPLDTQETTIKTIRRVIGQARSDWKDHKGRLVARDGTEWERTEAQLNGLVETMVDPLRRLQAEQFVHREHIFARDPELIAAAEALGAELRDTIASPQILDDLRGSLVGELSKFLPAPAPARLADDLPWPEMPAPIEIALEPLTQTILRER